MAITFEVEGRPEGKRRVRVVRGGVAYDPPENIAYQSRILAAFYTAAKRAKLWVEYPCVDIVAYYTLPKSTTKKARAKIEGNNIPPRVKPDVDNIAKIVLDALNGVAYKDDAYVWRISVVKVYSDRERLEITVSDLNERQ